MKGGRGPGGPCSAEGPRIRAISSCCSLMARARSGSLGEVLPPVLPLSRLGVAKSSSGGMGFRCPSLPYSTSLPRWTSLPLFVPQQIIHPHSHEPIPGVPCAQGLLRQLIIRSLCRVRFLVPLVPMAHAWICFPTCLWELVRNGHHGDTLPKRLLTTVLSQSWPSARYVH